MSDSGLCGCVPGHRMTVLESRCLDCGFTEEEYVQNGNRPCVEVQSIARTEGHPSVIDAQFCESSVRAPS